jgi:hypothetical protein
MTAAAHALLARLHETLRSIPQGTGFIYNAFDGWGYALIHTATDGAVETLSAHFGLGLVERRTVDISTTEICTAGLGFGPAARHTWYCARAEQPGAHLEVHGPHRVGPADGRAIISTPHHEAER